MNKIARIKLTIFSILYLLSGTLTLKAQQSATHENPLSKGWVTYLGKDSSLQIRTIGLVQIQARHLQLNPDTKTPTGEIKSSTTDLAVTRICVGNFMSYKQINLFYLFGNSGNSVATGKLGNFYTYEAYISYNLIPKALTLGIGQALYAGISRASSLSISKFITVDYNYLAIPGKSDMIGRFMEIYAIGQLGNLEYRTALYRPMLQMGGAGVYLPNLSASAPLNTSYDFPTDQFGAQAYLAWNFFDKENIQYSSKSFSYLGAKKIFNIGAGFQYQPKATAYLNFNRDTLYHNTLTLSSDFYLDMPLNSGAVITAYGAWYNYDYGLNYVKTGGSMNYFSGGTSPQGAGNSEFTLGTGNACFVELAWLFRQTFTPDLHRLQFYTYLYYKNYHALAQPSWQPGFGLNYYLFGQNAKIALQYYLRNVYDTNLKIADHKSDVMLQFQVSF
jgi:hypothetical protein